MKNWLCNSHSKSFLMVLALALLPVVSSAQEVDIGKFDRNMEVKTVTKDGLNWIVPFEKPFQISGLPWFEQDKQLRRLPVKPTVSIPHSVNILADYLSGVVISFRSNSAKLAVEVELFRPNNWMFNMAPIGSSSIDLYVGPPGSKRWAQAAAMKAGAKTCRANLFSNPSRKWREYTLYLPLYNGIRKLSIGLSPDAKIAPPSPYAGPEKIIIYGGSTVQGASASRPGLAHMNIVARRLNRELVNLGFSGSGKLEPELAMLVADIPNPGVILIEAERNARFEGVKSRLEPFIQILRRRHPRVPIVVMSANKNGQEWYSPSNRPAILEFMKTLVARLQKNDPNLYLFDSSELLGKDFDECSIDGSHPNDLGFRRMADGLTPFIEKLLTKK